MVDVTLRFVKIRPLLWEPRNNFGTMLRYRCLLFTLIFLGGCTSKPDYPNEPVIGFKTFTRQWIKQDPLGKLDSTTMVLTFTDGDANLGDETMFNVFLRDHRDSFLSNKFIIPVIPPLGGSGISGELYLTINSSCCYYPDGTDPCTPSNTFPTDTIQYWVYIVDRAGNQSNTLLTPPLILNCQ